MAKRPRESDDFLSSLDVGRILGEGAFAKVHHAKRGGSSYALKLVSRQHPDAATVAALERDVLRAIGAHKHIVSLVEYAETADAYALLLELAEGGEVFDRICEGPYSEADAATVVRQVATALVHMHSKGICHRDLKPENILLTSRASDADVKVADFGIAAFTSTSEPISGAAGTINYIAPEILADGPYGVEVDTWSLGVILFILLGAYNPFDPKSLSDRPSTRAAIKEGFDAVGFTGYPRQWRAVSDEAKDLIRAMLRTDPAERMSAEAVLAAPWVRACAHSTPLPGSEEALRAFNLGRRVWRTAAHVVAIVATAPTAVAASPRPGKGGAEFGGSSDGGALPPAMRDECRVAFAQFDVNGDGKISLNELRTAMRKLGAREARAEELMAAIDSNHDGVIDFAEFCKTVAPLYDGASGALRDVFDFIDAAGDGVISRQEASRIVANLCDMSAALGGTSQLSFDSFWAAVDRDADGTVSFDEFIQLFRRRDASIASTLTGIA